MSIVLDIARAIGADPSIIVSFVVRLIAFLAACYHAYRVVKLYRHRLQRLQNVILAAVVVIGTFAILSGIVRVINADWAHISAFVGAIASGSLLVGLLTIVYQWWRES